MYLYVSLIVTLTICGSLYQLRNKHYLRFVLVAADLYEEEETNDDFKKVTKQQ